MTPSSVGNRRCGEEVALECRLCYEAGQQFRGRAPSALEQHAYGLITGLHPGQLIVTEWRLLDRYKSADVVVLGQCPATDPPIAIHVDGNQHDKAQYRQLSKHDRDYDGKLMQGGVVVVRLHGKDKEGSSWLHLLQQAKTMQQQGKVDYLLSPHYSTQNDSPS